MSLESMYLLLKVELIFKWLIYYSSGPGSSVGIAAGYGLDGPGAHPASCTMGTGCFSGVKRPGRGADHPLPSSAL
jgi:hypothetical protein